MAKGCICCARSDHFSFLSEGSYPVASVNIALFVREDKSFGGVVGLGIEVRDAPESFRGRAPAATIFHSKNDVCEVRNLTPFH